MGDKRKNPAPEGNKAFNDTLKRMLNTAPDPRKPKKDKPNTKKPAK